MKLIDKKGRLFGKINIIDLFVMLIVVFILVGGFIRIQKNRLGNEHSKEVEIIVHIEDVRQATLDAIKVGENLNFYDKNTLFGEIVEKRISPYQDAIQTPENTLVLADVPGKYNLDLVVKCDALVSDEVVEVSNEHMRIGNKLYLKNRLISIKGYVFEMNLGE
jgi:hypothetical protein